MNIETLAHSDSLERLAQTCSDFEKWQDDNREADIDALDKAFAEEGAES
jgi:hypothetical protein